MAWVTPGYGVAMRISEVVQSKGGGVVTTSPATTVTGLLALLAEKGIGSVVITDDGHTIAGIVSERDVVRQLHASGPGVLDAPVSSIMTSEVITIRHDEDLQAVARTMTDHRVRHLPVIDDDDRLIGLVSIGDIVKARIDHLQSERDQLMAYIQQ